MAEPSNIRVNPFTGTGGATNYVELTEKHIIPSVSPYVIRLNEVPEKQDPSNMKMVYVDSETGAATENTLTEVAATPGQGEFRPDYSTNALDDKTWNTGLIEFSASDAGKIVQVTYTGTGTLAGVNSNHWPSWYTDRGDGSDGDFVPTENTTISGVKNYKSVFIKSGITVTVDKYALIKCQEAFINNGTITADGKGGTGGAGGESATDGSNGENGEASIGGAGGKASSKVAGAGGSPVYGTEIAAEIRIPMFGSGGGGGSANKDGYYGGTGGAGGGGIVIIAKQITSNITQANGTDGTAGRFSDSGGGGGGGGGSIVMIADNIVRGTTNANAGTGGGTTYKGAKGGTGYIFVKGLGV